MSARYHAYLEMQIEECRRTGSRDLELFEVFPKVSSLPASILSLHKLRRLGIYESGLETVPRNVCKLVNLTDLYLHNNKLTTLPHDIGRLVNLTLLCLAGNNFSSLPESVCPCKLPKLTLRS